MGKGSNKILGEEFTRAIQQEKAASSLELLRAAARRFSVSKARVDELGEIATSYLARIRGTDGVLAPMLSDGSVRAESLTNYAGAHEHLALVLTKLGQAKKHHAFVYGDLGVAFQTAEGLASTKEAETTLSDEFDGRPPLIRKTEFKVAS